MKAVVAHETGGPEVLALEEVPAPEPIPTEIQVAVHAAGVNPVDFKTRAGRGMSKLIGLPRIVGWDVSGVVSAVGAGVTKHSVGDEVCGMPWFPRQAGAYAEFVTAPSRQFVAKPHGLSHAEAAALPLAGLTAWQVLVDTIRLGAGDRVLLHGAAGGVGHLALQVARARGAEVIATARAEQGEELTALGADWVLDYRTDDFETALGDLDAVVDFPGAYGERSLSVLRRGGTLVLVPSGASPEVIEIAEQRGMRATGILVEPDPVGLEGLSHLVAEGKLRVNVARVFPLAEAAAAHRLAEESHGGGKIVLDVGG